METQIRKKITWTIKNFSSLKMSGLYSDQFVAGGCKWYVFQDEKLSVFISSTVFACLLSLLFCVFSARRVCAYPRGNNVDYLFLYLEVADFESLPTGWKRHARYLLSIVNHKSFKRCRSNGDYVPSLVLALQCFVQCE